MVAPARFKTVRVEAVDGNPIGGVECDMRSRSRRAFCEVEPQGRLTGRTKARTRLIARAKHMTERGERRGVEAHACVDILHL